MQFVLKKLNIIFAASAVVFTIGYILFSSWSTSLDFKLDQISQKQNEIGDEYEQRLASLAQARGRDYLSEASAKLNLVEVDLTAGYLAIHPATADSSETLAKNIQN